MYSVERTQYSPGRRLGVKINRDGRLVDSSLADNPKAIAALRSRVAQSSVVQPVGRASILSTPRAAKISQIRMAFNRPLKEVICASRKVLREIVFASGGAGQSRRYPNRKVPSKVKC